MKFQKLTPNLAIKNVRHSVNFYRDLLGFTLDTAVCESSCTVENDLSGQGEHTYAMVSRDDAYVMFLRADYFEKDVPVPKGFPRGTSALFYIDVEGVDDLYRQLKGQADIVKDLETTWYGMREFYITDCDGYVLGSAEKA